MNLGSKRLFAAAVRLRLAVALVPLVFCMAGSVARAQTADSTPPIEPPPEPRPAHSVHRPRNVDSELDRLIVKLHLTTDQQARVRNILDRRRAELLQLRKAESLNAMDRFTKLDAVKHDALEEIDGLLTDEQRKIFRPTVNAPTVAKGRARIEGDWTIP